MTAATWIFACGLVMSFFGMVMIMLRGAYYPFFVWDDYYYDDEKGIYSTEESDPDLVEDDEEDFSAQDPEGDYDSKDYDVDGVLLDDSNPSEEGQELTIDGAESGTYEESTTYDDDRRRRK